ncbi:DUF938 domain-containing protein [Variovorax terrae]|uniref:Class I SAM-dependent methyltransferase n=1 Tax=Variovorax terrae TaxID=2923278 RepID=A0A9X1VV45_9BURK|nr:DUF938 domain-containing protein [Variovorax terrae]MCJ0762422.1 class I SAM-dependent methyltransferase [Variovorax terrae]
MSGAQHSPAAERNRQPILEVLRELLPAHGRALEIASGTGQHVAWFAAALPGWNWQPTDADAGVLPSIAAWCAEAPVPNVRAPQRLDVMAPTWPAFDGPFDAIYCANLLHIAPWATCAALMQGAARHLAPRGQLILYGPYLQEGVPTSPGNLAFDRSLRERNPAWGLRRLDEVARQAALAGLPLASRFQMPAHNLLLAFKRQGASPPVQPVS